MSTSRKWYAPYISPLDPCPPLSPIAYETPAQLYLGFQPQGLEQFSPFDALVHGTLWPALFTPYTNPYQSKKRGEF